MRVVVGGLMQESNSFSPIHADLDGFRRSYLVSGSEILDRFRGKGAELSGFIAAAEREGVSLLPTVAAAAPSAGPLGTADFVWLVEQLVEGVERAGACDGVLLALHGAWVANDEPDADGYVLARVREVVGPSVPIAATLDIHANVTHQMVERADILVGYRTYPHVDMRETGERAAGLLFQAARGGARPVTYLRKLPMIVPPENSQTTDGPMAEVEAVARQVEARPGILAASAFPVQPWLDVPELGFAATVVSQGPADQAREAADEIARAAWERRSLFLVALFPPDQAVSQALAAAGPVALIDSADGTSSGAPGDGTAILHALLEAQPRWPADRVALATVVDPESARAAVTAGVGARLDLILGGSLDPARHQPVAASAVVERVGTGQFKFSAGVGDGLAADMGSTAVVRLGEGGPTIYAVVMEKAVATYDPALYRSVGLEPSEAQIVVLKTPTNHRWTYRDIARSTIYVDAPAPRLPGCLRSTSGARRDRSIPLTTGSFTSPRVQGASTAPDIRRPWGRGLFRFDGSCATPWIACRDAVDAPRRTPQSQEGPVIKIAEVLPPRPTPLWRLAKQCGIDYVVGTMDLRRPIDYSNPEDLPWSYTSLLRLKTAYDDAGFSLEVLESRPPLTGPSLGCRGRDEEIEQAITLIRNLGALGIPVWCYEWMPVFNWMRTSTTTPSRGGALATGLRLRADEERAAHRVRRRHRGTALGRTSSTSSTRVVPVAEAANVKLAMHPDDPPLSPIRGLGRIMRSIENYQRLLDLYPSPVNGIALCQGNFTLMTDDLPGGDPALRQAGQDLLRALPRRAGHAGEVRRDLPRRRQDRHARLHGGLPRRRLRGGLPSRPRADDGRRQQRPPGLLGHRPPLRHRLPQGPARGRLQTGEARVGGPRRRRSQLRHTGAVSETPS